MNIVLLNGPPRCGKDTVAQLVTSKYPYFVHLKFAALIKEWTHRLYAIPEDVIPTLEDTKDEPNEYFYGLTPREAYIAVSEKYIKPVHGEDFPGRMLAKDILALDPNLSVIISDLGFQIEVEVVAEKCGAENLTVITMHRPMKNFQNDSRSYIRPDYMERAGVQNFTLYNNGDTLELLDKAESILALIESGRKSTTQSDQLCLH